MSTSVVVKLYRIEWRNKALSLSTSVVRFIRFDVQQALANYQLVSASYMGGTPDFLRYDRSEENVWTLPSAPFVLVAFVCPPSIWS